MSFYPLDYLDLSLPISTFGKHLHGTEISSYTVCIQGGLPTHFLHRSPCHQFSNCVLSDSLTIKPNHWQKSINQHRFIPLAISPFKHSENLMHHLKFCWLEGSPLTTGFLDRARVVLSCFRCSLLYSVSISCRASVSQTWVFLPQSTYWRECSMSP